SFGMQYVQRKLQRSVTEMRRSCSGRPSESGAGVSGIRVSVVMEELEKDLPGAGYGAGPMANYSFLVLRQFGGCAVLMGGEEDRVVAEAVVAARLWGDEAAYIALGEADVPGAGIGDGDDGYEAGGSPVQGQAGDAAFDLCEALGVGGVRAEEAG